MKLESFSEFDIPREKRAKISFSSNKEKNYLLQFIYDFFQKIRKPTNQFFLCSCK